MSSGSVVKSTYGHEIASNNDEYIKLASNALIDVLSLGMIGLNYVDAFPFCKSGVSHCFTARIVDLIFSEYAWEVNYVRTWCPKSSLIGKAIKGKLQMDRMINEPYEYVKSQRV